MQTRIDYLKSWLVRTQKTMDSIAHAAMKTALTPDAYNVARGRYKQLNDMAVAFGEEIKRIDGGDDDAIGEPEPDTGGDDEDFELPQPRRATRKPRQWGGN